MDIITLNDDLIQEAYDYAYKSKDYLSDRHSFHSGTTKDKLKKMYEGKLGEKIFKQYMLNNNLKFKEDSTHYTKADDYDFILKEKYSVDVKTRTQNYHIRTLEMVEQFKKKPKDVYVSVRLYAETNTGYIVGWFGRNDVKKNNRIENNGYLDNYVFYDNELRNIDVLLNILISGRR